MCVVSMVLDQWAPGFPPPNQFPSPYPFPPAQPVITVPGVVTMPSAYSEETLRRLIDSFQEALAAAREFDEITGQPNCEDAEKAKLIERVADVERRLAAVEGCRAPTRRKLPW